MREKTLQWRFAVALVCVLSLSGCFLVAAGAGAGAAIVFTNRGASSLVDGTVDQAYDRSVAVFQELAIAQTGSSTEESGAKRRLVGTKGDLEVTVELSRSTASTTSAEVYAKRNVVDYDKDFAKDVLNRIIQK